MLCIFGDSVQKVQWGSCGAGRNIFGGKSQKVVYNLNIFFYDFLIFSKNYLWNRPILPVFIDKDIYVDTSMEYTFANLPKFYTDKVILNTETKKKKLAIF